MISEFKTYDHDRLGTGSLSRIHRFMLEFAAGDDDAVRSILSSDDSLDTRRGTSLFFLSFGYSVDVSFNFCVAEKVGGNIPGECGGGDRPYMTQGGG